MQPPSSHLIAAAGFGRGRGVMRVIRLGKRSGARGREVARVPCRLGPARTGAFYARRCHRSSSCGRRVDRHGGAGEWHVADRMRNTPFGADAGPEPRRRGIWGLACIPHGGRRRAGRGGGVAHHRARTQFWRGGAAAGLSRIGVTQ